jgi:hypothetical protein
MSTPTCVAVGDACGSGLAGTCSAGACGSCGGAGERCCANSRCTASNTTCQASVGGGPATCGACGGANQPCCLAVTGGTRTCNSGMVCAPSFTSMYAYSCAACGGMGQPCCSGNICTAGQCKGYLASCQ